MEDRLLHKVADRPPPGVATTLITQHTGTAPMVQELGQR